MAKGLILESFDEDATSFNIDSFLDQLFDTISNYRSQIGLQEGKVVEYPDEAFGAKNAESKLNAFYRILGFPAVRGDLSVLELDEKTKQNTLSQHKTLNYFDDFSIDGFSVAKAAAERENFLYQELDYQESLNVIMNPLKFTEAVKGNERRSSIFPLVVNASIPVFPVSKRTAPMFYDGEFILQGDQKRLTRPFIEHIIYMRTKVFAGAETQYSKDLKNQIRREILDFQKEELLIKTIEQTDLFSLRIIGKLIRALKKCSAQFKDVEENITRLRKDVEFVPAPKENPSEKAGNVSDALAADLQKDSISEKGLESEIAAIKNKMAAEDIFIMLMPSEIIKKADRIRRIEDEVPNTSVSDDIFLSEFNYLISYEKNAYYKKLLELEDKKARFIAEYEHERMSLIHLNGEVTGLSIFDVICILLALFTVDIKFLFAIINADSLNSLKNSDLYYKAKPAANSDNITTFSNISSTIIGAEAVSVAEGLKAIQDKVAENFEIARMFYLKAQASGENRN